MFRLRVAVVSSLLLFAVACSSYSTPSPAPSSTPAPSSASPAPAPGTPAYAVSIPVGASVLANRAFAPDELNVAVGGTVTWTNSDSVAHTSSSDSADWESGIVQPGAQFSRSFPAAGTYAYHCAIHPGMVGTIVVR